MPKKTTFTRDELKAYFYGEVKGPYYKAAQEQAARLRVHADGEYPKALVEERRPHEDPEVQKYRASVWKAKTKPTFTRVLNSLSKIRRSSDWQILYPLEDFPRIPDGERLEDYCERGFPYFTSVTNWVFSVMLRHYLIDPNAVVLVRPLEAVEDPTAFVKPYPVIYSSACVIDFREENYCILKDPAGTQYYDDAGRAWQGDSFLVVTTMSVQRYAQVSGNYESRYALVSEQVHGLGFLPVYQLKAVVKASTGDAFLYESRIDAMVEELDEAAREYSDLQAARVMNIFPERWEVGMECNACKGTGEIPTATPGQSAPCETCHGNGKVSASGPYSKILISRTISDAGQALPIPPAGYVQKDVEVVKIQDEGVEKHLYSALAAINMEFLAAVPLSQSGIAKEVDRDETTNFVHSIAEDIVRIMDWIYLAIASWRYGVQYSAEDIARMAPAIPVPEHFDLFSTRYAEEDIKNSKDNKLNPVIIAAMELSYAAKKFSAEPEVRDQLMLVFSLDPFQNVSEEDKNARLRNDAIREIDYIISSNINHFVKRAVIEDETFPLKPYAEQRKVLEGYAQAIIDENSAAKQVQAPFLPGGTEDDTEDTDFEVVDGENVEQIGLNGANPGQAEEQEAGT